MTENELKLAVAMFEKLVLPSVQGDQKETMIRYHQKCIRILNGESEPVGEVAKPKEVA